jgi:hypothetical protein
MFGIEIGNVLSILAIGILVVGAARLLRRWALGDLLRGEHQSAPPRLAFRKGSPWTMVDWVVVSLCVLLPLASTAFLMLGWSSGSKR